MKFRSGNFFLEDEDRTKRPVEFDNKLLGAALEKSCFISWGIGNLITCFIYLKIVQKL